MAENGLKHTYGWVKDDEDIRDFKFKVEKYVVLPEEFELPNLPPVLDQKTLGSCTGHGVGQTDFYTQLTQKDLDAALPSRLMIYYGEREMEGTIGEDSGAQIRDGVKFLAKSGCCPEQMWPYDISKFTQRPPQPCWDEALKHQAIQYESVNQTLNDIQTALVSGFMVVFGFTVFASFETDSVARTGIVPMPKPGEQELGGHCTTFCGFSNKTRMLKCMNSWSDQWGDRGFFYLPYDFVLNKNWVSDLWILKIIEDDQTPTPAPVVTKSWIGRVIDWFHSIF